jgi:hypothetical protein
MIDATTAVAAPDPGRLRQLQRLLAAHLPVAAVVMPESGGLGGMRAFLARSERGVARYDLVPGATPTNIAAVLEADPAPEEIPLAVHHTRPALNRQAARPRTDERSRALGLAPA